MKWTNTLICLLCLGVSSCGVMQEPADCPPATSGVVVAVHDKNYDNAAEVGAPLLDENLPMLSYINTLVLRNYVRDTGRELVYDETIAAAELVHPIDPSRFVPNINDMTATGGYGVGARQYISGQDAVTLHPDGLEGEDIYMGFEEIIYPVDGDKTIWLYRTKGLLMIEPANMPEEVWRIEISISGLRATADSAPPGTTPTPDPIEKSIIYNGTVAVSKSFDTTAAGAGTRFSTMLAPSVEAISPLTITFVLADGSTETVSTEVSIIRNHITLIRPEYNVAARTWTIEVMINGNWVKIENLNITD